MGPLGESCPWYVQFAFSAYLIILTQVLALAWTLVELTWISGQLSLGTRLGPGVLSTYPDLPKLSTEAMGTRRDYWTECLYGISIDLYCCLQR
jgi:hypothetical protein